ncbi:MAG: choice-of-anchor J domain-containing protein [Candidatus Eisenbacteria bacterium]|nr:choice-of-anchor J domain-containing protein [Candidatus Eisenbacteria bacterium]
MTLLRSASLALALVSVGAASAKTVYETGFENELQLPPGWAIESHGPGDDWGFGGNPQDWHMRARYGTTGEQDEWLLSPVLDLSGETGISVQFWQWFRTFGSGVGQLRVSVGGGPWETLVEYDSDQFGEPVISVPQAGGQSSVRFCWRYLASLDYQWDVDDVRVMSEVAVDVRVVSTRGPRADDHIRQGADLPARVVFRNEGSQPTPEGTVRFTVGAEAWNGTIPAGIATGDTLAVSFLVPGQLLGGAGDLELIVVADMPGDAVAANDTLRVGPLHVTTQFPNPGTVLLNYDDPADSALFAGLLLARGESYDCWNRRAGGLERNLYGLDGWRVVCFTETEIYPSISEQYALMRFLDQPAPGLKRGLLISGDEWVRFYDTGSVAAEFVEVYLRMGGGQEYPQEMPTLFPVPDNLLGFDRIVTTSASRPDIVKPNPELPGAVQILTYDQEQTAGAMAGVRTPSYQAIATGFEWGQLIVGDEQAGLAGSCADWLLAARSRPAVGDAFRLDVAPNPATDRLCLSVPDVGPDGGTASLVDLAGRRAAAWLLPTAGALELRLPMGITAGAYCLVVAPGTGEHLRGPIVVWR